MTIQVINPQSKAEWEIYYQLRWQILRAPWQQPHGSEKDAQEAESFHVMAMDGSLPVGVGRLHANSQDEMQIRFMAVIEPRRGQGVGALLLAALEQEALRRQARSIVLQARLEAVEFYQAHGYHITGPGNILFGEIQHRYMQKILVGK